MTKRVIPLHRIVADLNNIGIVGGGPGRDGYGAMAVADAWGIPYVRGTILVGGNPQAGTGRLPNTFAINPLTVYAQDVAGFNYLYNGATWDLQENNTQSTPLAAAVRAATTDSATQTNYNARGLHLAFNVTAVTAAQTVTPVLQSQDPVSLTWYDLLVGPAIGAVGLTILKLYPGLAAVPSLAAPDILPRTWRVEVRHSAGGNFTYSAGANLVI